MILVNETLKLKFWIIESKKIFLSSLNKRKDEGRIVEIGGQKELLTSGELFSLLHSLKFSSFDNVTKGIVGYMHK